MKDASSCAAFARGWMRRKNGALHSAANVFLRLSASTSIASKTSGKKLVALVCEAPAAYKPPGFHKMIPGRPNAHYGWPMASKRGYNSTRNPQRDERTKFAAEKGEKNAKCWGTHPSVPPPLGRHPSGLPPFGPPTFWEVCSLSLSHPSQLHLRDLPTSVQFFHDQINAVILHQRVVHDDLCCRSGSRLRAVSKAILRASSSATMRSPATVEDRVSIVGLCTPV